MAGFTKSLQHNGPFVGMSHLNGVLPVPPSTPYQHREMEKVSDLSP